MAWQGSDDADAGGESPRPKRRRPEHGATNTGPSLTRPLNWRAIWLHAIIVRDQAGTFRTLKLSYRSTSTGSTLVLLFAVQRQMEEGDMESKPTPDQLLDRARDRLYVVESQLRGVLLLMQASGHWEKDTELSNAVVLLHA